MTFRPTYLATAVCCAALHLTMAFGVEAPVADAEAASLFASGVAAFEDGRHEAAMFAFTALAKDHPQSLFGPPARFMQAKALASMARFEDAVVVLDAFLEGSPSSPLAYDALMLRGESLVAASALAPHFREAAISFSMAMESDGIPAAQRGRAAYRLLDTLLRMGEDENAAKILAELGDEETEMLQLLARQERNIRMNGLAKSARAAASDSRRQAPLSPTGQPPNTEPQTSP